MNKENSRRTAVKLLERVEQGGAYSNILLDEQLLRSRMDAQDKKFCTALFYGTLERRLTLDAVIADYSDRPADKLDHEVRNILRTALFQLLYMDSVPDSAAVNEAVKLASRSKNPAVKGYVNGLLRSFIRAEKRLPEPAGLAERLSIVYSCPVPLVKKWLDELGEKNTLALLGSSLGRPPVTVKVNTLKITADELCNALAEEGIDASVNRYFADCLDFRGSSPEDTAAYRDGLYHVQDISSRICCECLDARPGMTVLDMCSAPGGKTFTIGELMRGEGSIYSYDLHEKRAGLVAKGAARLGLDIVAAGSNNAKLYNCNVPMADRVLCDVPCSGLGVIRRKPEIKYKDLTEFAKLPEIQYDILDTSSRYVKQNGLLVYSTCTLSKAENDDVTNRFLSEHTDFEPAELCSVKGLEGLCRTSILPSQYDSDGFYIAKFRRVK